MNKEGTPGLNPKNWNRKSETKTGKMSLLSKEWTSSSLWGVEWRRLWATRGTARTAGWWWPVSRKCSCDASSWTPGSTCPRVLAGSAHATRTATYSKEGISQSFGTAIFLLIAKPLPSKSLFPWKTFSSNNWMFEFKNVLNMNDNSF